MTVEARRQAFLAGQRADREVFGVRQDLREFLSGFFRRDGIEVDLVQDEQAGPFFHLEAVEVLEEGRGRLFGRDDDDDDVGVVARGGTSRMD